MPGIWWHLKDNTFPALPSASLTSHWPFYSVFISNTMKGCGQKAILPSFSFADIGRKDQQSNPKWQHGALSAVIPKVHRMDGRLGKLDSVWLDWLSPIVEYPRWRRTNKVQQLCSHGMASLLSSYISKTVYFFLGWGGFLYISLITFYEFHFLFLVMFIRISSIYIKSDTPYFYKVQIKRAAYCWPSSCSHFNNSNIFHSKASKHTASQHMEQRQFK